MLSAAEQSKGTSICRESILMRHYGITRNAAFMITKEVALPAW